jgi:tetratricopeptide (TPR) repeat protein
MADVDASKWFTLGANADRASGDLAGALKQYQAAAAAAPNLGGNQSAVALVAYELNEADILSKSASAALALAPETTNPWFTFGLSVAQMGDTINHQKMASGAFLLSLHYSRDTMFTRKYLLKSSEQARDTRVSRAILDALREHALNPRIFGEPNAPRVSQ